MIISRDNIYDEINNYLVENSRIYFSQLNINGLSDFHEYSVMPELYKYLEFEPFKTINESELYLKKLFKRMKKSNHKSNYWFIHLKNKKIIGTIALLRNIYNSNDMKEIFKDNSIINFDKSGELGNGLSPAFWRQGLMSEAMKSLIDFSFKSLDLDFLWCKTRIDNIPNIKLMEKLGFEKLNIIKSFYKNNLGDIHDAQILCKRNSLRQINK